MVVQEEEDFTILGELVVDHAHLQAEMVDVGGKGLGGLPVQLPRL